MSKIMTIGKAAAHTGVTADTLRFYESKGLLKRPARNASGYRVYTPENIERIRFIKRARELGFTLSDVAHLISIIETGPKACCAIRTRIQDRITDIDGDIHRLQGTRERLMTLADACAEDISCADCRLLKALPPTPIAMTLPDR